MQIINPEIIIFKYVNMILHVTAHIHTNSTWYIDRYIDNFMGWHPESVFLMNFWFHNILDL